MDAALGGTESEYARSGFEHASAVSRHPVRRLARDTTRLPYPSIERDLPLTTLSRTMQSGLNRALQSKLPYWTAGNALGHFRRGGSRRKFGRATFALPLSGRKRPVRNEWTGRYRTPSETWRDRAVPLLQEEGRLSGSPVNSAFLANFATEGVNRRRRGSAEDLRGTPPVGGRVRVYRENFRLSSGKPSGAHMIGVGADANFSDRGREIRKPELVGRNSFADSSAGNQSYPDNRGHDGCRDDLLHQTHRLHLSNIRVINQQARRRVSHCSPALSVDFFMTSPH